MSSVLPLEDEGNAASSAPTAAPAGGVESEGSPPLQPLPLNKPEIGDRVLVLREPWLAKILSGEKTLEIRSRACRHGRVWLGCGGKVYGCVDIVDTETLTEQEFRDKGALHHWPADEPVPYNKIVGWTLSGARALEPPLPYWRPRTAIGWNLFREKEDDLPPQSRKKRAIAPEGSSAIDGEEEEQEEKEEAQGLGHKRNKAQLRRHLTTQLDDDEGDGSQDGAEMEVGEPASAAEPCLFGEGEGDKK